MEFETNTKQSIDDAARLAAEMRQLTITPLHDNVAPEEEPESIRVAQHLSEPAIPNTLNDTEDTQSLVSH